MESIQQGPHLVFYLIVVLNPITVFCNKIQKRKTIIALKKQNDSNYSLLVKHTPLGEKSVRAEGNPVFPEVCSGNSNNH